MKIATRLRRSSAGADGPASSYAGILDGETLWLAVEATPGTLALRDAAGDLHPLRSDLPDDDPAYLAVRAPLLGLLDAAGPGEATYDVVLVPPDGRPRPVTTAPLERGRTTVPPTRDGRWQLGLGRSEDGTLQVHRRPLRPGLDVLRIDREPDAIRLTLAPPDPPFPHDASLVLLDGEDVVASYALGGDGSALLTVAGLPAGRGQLVRLAVGALPLRRWANDLRDAQAAVLLPQLDIDGEDVLRLRWAPDGTLTARLLERERSAGA